MPVPERAEAGILVQAANSLISIGTERMLVEFGKANMLQKAKQHPETVKMVLGKICTDGLGATIDAVKSKLDQPLPLGYCHVGRVIGVGQEASEFQVGERVVSNGSHASVVSVSRNLE